MFKRRAKSKKDEVEIPGWTENPYKILAQALQGSGLAESWEGKLGEAEPLDVVKLLEGFPVKTGDDIPFGRQGWILLSTYRKFHKSLEEAREQYHQLEHKNIELEGKTVMMQCGQHLFQDKYDHYQNIAETTAVSLAKEKYKLRRGRVNKAKVHKLVASAILDWDPGKWDGDVWDLDTDTDDWDDCPGGLLCPDLETDPPCNPMTKLSELVTYHAPHTR